MGHERMTEVPEVSPRARQVTEMMALFVENSQSASAVAKTLADVIIGDRDVSAMQAFRGLVSNYANRDPDIAAEFGRNDWARVDWEEIAWRLSGD